MPDKQIYGEEVSAETFSAMKQGFDCATGGFVFSKEIYGDLFSQDGAVGIRTYPVVFEGLLTVAITAVDENLVDFGKIYERGKGID